MLFEVWELGESGSDKKKGRCACMHALADMGMTHLTPGYLTPHFSCLLSHPPAQVEYASDPITIKNIHPKHCHTYADTI